MLQPFDENWLRAVASAIAGTAACITAWREQRHVVRHADLRPVIWAAVAAVLVVMAASHVVAAGALLSEAGRQLVLDAGWYAHRRVIQAFVIAVLGATWLTLNALIVWRLRSRYLPTALAVSALLAVLAIRVVSLHHVDVVVRHRRVLGASVSSVIEVGLLVLVCVLMWRADRALRRAAPVREPTPSGKTPDPEGALVPWRGCTNGIACHARSGGDADASRGVRRVRTAGRGRGDSPGGGGLARRVRFRVGREVRGFVGRIAGTMRAAPRRASARIVGVTRIVSRELPEITLWTAERGRLVSSRSSTVRRLELVFAARLHGWRAALEHVDALPAAAASRPGAETWSQRVAAAIVGNPHAGASRSVTPPAIPRPAALPSDVAERIIVYTTCFADDQPPPPLYTRPDGVRFVCFTDGRTHGGDWETVLVPRPADPSLERARYRIRPHEVLAEIDPRRDLSLYIDAATFLIGNLDTLFTRWLVAHALVMFRDRRATGWWDLAERHVIAGSMSAAEMTLLTTFEDAGAATDAGAYETSFIWRRHLRTAVVELMEQWWELAARAPHLDDLLLAGVLGGRSRADESDERPDGATDRRSTHPMALPLSLGDSQEGTYAALVRSNPPPVWSATGGVVPMSSGRVKIAFLRHPVANEEITTFLRGEQLSRIIADRFPDVYDVTYTDDASSLRDHVVIVVKQALQRLEPAEIESLGRRNIAVVNAWDDQIPDQARIEAGDVQMVFSLSQLTQMRREHPGRSVHFVTQHVNLQFPTGTPPDDRLRIGYFGADYNTRIPPPVSSVVDVVDTRADVALWSPQLLRHNCHWIIRRSQEWDGGKPFMKGFVAARYGAPVIVSPLQDDAMYYLGDDYPYYAPGSAVEMELLLAEMASGFGGPEWLRAQEIMRQVAARSSLSHVCADFKRMVDDIVG